VDRFSVAAMPHAYERVIENAVGHESCRLAPVPGAWQDPALAW